MVRSRLVRLPFELDASTPGFTSSLTHPNSIVQATVAREASSSEHQNLPTPMLGVLLIDIIARHILVARAANA
jgi:hypothetical protein